MWPTLGHWEPHGFYLSYSFVLAWGDRAFCNRRVAEVWVGLVQPLGVHRASPTRVEDLTLSFPESPMGLL